MQAIMNWKTIVEIVIILHKEYIVHVSRGMCQGDNYAGDTDS